MNEILTEKQYQHFIMDYLKTNNIYDYFRTPENIMTCSAFIQQRNKLKPEALNIYLIILICTTFQCVLQNKL